MSPTRKRYFIHLYGRIAVFIGCLIMCLYPNNYSILDGMNFFDKFYILHILWFIWILGMTIIGVLFNIFILYLKGFIFGFSLSAFIITYSYKGIILSILYINSNNIFKYF